MHTKIDPARPQTLAHGYRVCYDIPFHDDKPQPSMDLYTPFDAADSSKEQRPAILYFHGGGWEEGDKSKGQERIIPLLDTGYIFISVGYSLSGDAPWPAAMLDCNAALSYVQRHAAKLHINPSKIALWGSSSGGHLACLVAGGCLADHPPEIACLVDYCAPITVEQYVQQRIDAGETDCPVVRLLGGFHKDTLKFAQQASVLNWVKPGYPTTLIAHGENDEVVPLEQSEILLNHIQAVGSEAELFIVPNAPHRLENDALHSKVKEFFQQQLGEVK